MVRGSNPTSGSQLLMYMFGRPGSISALVGSDMAVRHLKSATTERFLGRDGRSADEVVGTYLTRKSDDALESSENKQMNEDKPFQFAERGFVEGGISCESVADKAVYKHAIVSGNLSFLGDAVPTCISINLKLSPCRGGGRASLLTGTQFPKVQPYQEGQRQFEYKRATCYADLKSGFLNNNGGKKSFSCSTLSVPSCHATRGKHEGWDTARLPKPRQGESRGRGQVRTTDLPVTPNAAAVMFVRRTAGPKKARQKSEMVEWLQRKFTDRGVCSWNPTPASQFFLFRFAHTGSTPALVPPSGGIAVRHRKNRNDGRGFLNRSSASSAVAPFRCLAAMPPEGSTRVEILSGCPSLRRRIQDAEVELEPRTSRLEFVS
ncbi:hypothetical protein T265_07935 [Opisthorchis viverrini]|uniref:Uncharacterized protein n=1 Tax=Opisthorchis viverrini TaxID=6198 RepID=A0A074ZAP6_OPIVI|nr:hypothetical protein T265_07935 [Opisthorchis viverrini]KER24376.1 hypothetical protein T265_07935 [Opisthorchis viverrini]